MYIVMQTRRGGAGPRAISSVMVRKNEPDSCILGLPPLEGHVVVAGCHHHPHKVHHDKEAGQEHQAKPCPEVVRRVVDGGTLNAEQRADRAERGE